MSECTSARGNSEPVELFYPGRVSGVFSAMRRYATQEWGANSAHSHALSECIPPKRRSFSIVTLVTSRRKYCPQMEFAPWAANTDGLFHIRDRLAPPQQAKVLRT
ncbi:hypothetical protein MTP99_002480 [Tenebrio molitor]|nr:hypothetical protein MTP99_002480 [Tenebrio molitor]